LAWVASVTDALLHDLATASAPSQEAPSVDPHTDELSAQLAEALVRIGKLENDCAEYKKLVALLQEPTSACSVV
jgi:hypothetical protein